MPERLYVPEWITEGPTVPLQLIDTRNRQVRHEWHDVVQLSTVLDHVDHSSTAYDDFELATPNHDDSPGHTMVTACNYVTPKTMLVSAPWPLNNLIRETAERLPSNGILYASHIILAGVNSLEGVDSAAPIPIQHRQGYGDFTPGQATVCLGSPGNPPEHTLAINLQNLRAVHIDGNASKLRPHHVRILAKLIGRPNIPFLRDELDDWLSPVGRYITKETIATYLSEIHGALQNYTEPLSYHHNHWGRLLVQSPLAASLSPAQDLYNPLSKKTRRVFLKQ